MKVFHLKGVLAVAVLALCGFLASLKSVDLLDPAIAAKQDPQTLKQLMQLHNKLFCAADLHKEALAGATSIKFANVSMFVYDTNDIVSNQLRGAHHTWESSEINEMLWALRQHQAVQQLAAQQGKAPGPAVPLMVDVGANIGWFTLNAAAARARVVAFEAMSSNIALLRRSLCANPWLQDRIALFGTGLGPKSSNCLMISGNDNQGDGFTKCDEGKDYKAPDGYAVRGEMTTRRLDTLLAEDVLFMKMDVEGYEQQVLEGATALLREHNVWYIMAECNTGMIGEERGKQFIKFMHSQGYATSPFGFKGPFWSDADVQSGAARCSNINVFCVKQSALPLASSG
ncbi:hypothetical protein OEZ86_002886 [Tetradesmus obliquus]|nr:hypothetical protein OEZ86_002886 [Tetradesmus obliquus]